MQDGEPLAPHHHMALNFLLKAHSDCIGVIDSEEKMAAGLVYAQLKARGYIYSMPSDDGPVWRLTSEGKSVALRTALASSGEAG